MAHSTSPMWVKEMNEALKSSIQRRDNHKVQVLVLYWEAGEDGYKEEGRAVRAMFQDIFHYPASEFAIPSTGSYYHLLGAVSQALAQIQSGASLLIIHYGGHGDQNGYIHDGENRRAVWAAHDKGEPTVKWYEIQNFIMDSETDILLLIDSCYAGQASRGRHHNTGRFEILAAAAMGVKTHSYGEQSFTTALVREMSRAIKQSGNVVIKDLHNTLNKAEQNLFAQPIHISLKPGQSLRLAPLPLTSPSAPREIEGEQSFLRLFIYAKEQLTHENTAPITEWLEADLPGIVSHVEVFDRTEHAQKIIEHLQKGDRSFIKPDDSARFETLGAWDRVVDLFEEFSKQMGTRGGKKEERERFQENFLKRLDQESNDVVQLLERSILTSPEIVNQETVEEALGDSSIQGLGMTNQLQMRRIVSLASQPEDIKTGPEISPDQAAPDITIVRETKIYGFYVNPEDIKARVSLLVKLLASPKDTEFCSLQCLGWSHQEFEQKFTLDFQVPEGVYENQFLTLHSIIQRATGLYRPSLNQRLRIAYSLARAVEKWHLVGWLHQGISAPNVIFFLKESKSPDYARPYLHGFEFARPDTDPSLGRPTHDGVSDIYRHPERQGAVRQGHRRKHDFYSLGVVLLEIGLWQTATEIVKRSQPPPASAYEIQDLLQKNGAQRLAHYAGDAYQAVVGICLGSKFGVDVDDEKGSRLLKAFHDKVVDELAKGILL